MRLTFAFIIWAISSSALAGSVLEIWRHSDDRPAPAMGLVKSQSDHLALIVDGQLKTMAWENVDRIEIIDTTHYTDQYLIKITEADSDTTSTVTALLGNAFENIYDYDDITQHVSVANYGRLKTGEIISITSVNDVAIDDPEAAIANPNNKYLGYWTGQSIQNDKEVSWCATHHGNGHMSIAFKETAPGTELGYIPSVAQGKWGVEGDLFTTTLTPRDPYTGRWLHQPATIETYEVTASSANTLEMRSTKNPQHTFNSKRHGNCSQFFRRQ